MTRDNHNKSNRTQSPLPLPSPNEDSILDLPDLSAFPEAEKRHILGVLVRNEDLRNRHLARFMNLRKEVAELEEQSTTASPSVCARCQTPFRFVFNTGDACPKCSAKVCKQCRLMYNVNDNSWLCQLCCKQMQLMSYSGEWIYALHSNLRKGSRAHSEDDVFTLPSVSRQNINGGLSSSDSDVEIPVAIGPALKPDRFRKKSVAVANPAGTKPEDKGITMIVQNARDLKKLNIIKERIKQRPEEMSYTQPLPRRNPIRPSPLSLMPNSSDDLNFVINQPSKRHSSLNKLNSPMPRNLGTLKQDEKEFDAVSVTSSEWGEVEDPNKLEKVQSQQQLQQQTSQASTHGSKLSVTSASTLKANRRHISTSMHNLRNRVLHRPREALPSTSSTAEMNNKVERPVTPPINDENSIPSKPNISNSRTSLRSRLTSVKKDEPTQLPPLPPKSIQSRHGSGNITNSTNAIASKPLDRHVSMADTVKTDYTRQESRPESNYNRSSVGDDSDDDMDHKPGKPKTGPKRATSLRDIRGSRLSLNSMMSDAKANYSLEITGTIQLKLSYNPKTGALDVYIRQCTNLASVKRNQTSNPYCKTYLLPNKSKESKRKTQIRKGTTSPLFDEILRYHLTLQEFSSRTLWVSVWSASSLGHNDFLGEIHIPLASCKIDELEEYTLLPKKEEEKEKEEEVNPVAQSTADHSELYFELSFIPNTKNKDVGTIEVNKIQATGIHYGKTPVEAICKALLMPDKHKRKLPTTRKGPTPKWDIPLRWENVRAADLKQCSMEISIWNQERFRKTMLFTIRLNSARTHLDSRPVKLLVPSAAERAIWESFQKDPTRVHRARLTLRPAIIEPK